MTETEPVPIHRARQTSSIVKTLMVAHRCGANLGPENTRSAVVQSSFFRPDYYEIDVRHTSDGVAICMHDATLDRTTDITGEVSNLTLDEIQVADAGGWVSDSYMGEMVPTFEQMSDGVNPSPLAIELKESEITVEQCKTMINVLNENRDISSVVMSFHGSALETWRTAEESTPRPVPTRTVFLTTEVTDFALDGPHDAVGILKSECTHEVVFNIRETGKAIWVWTVNDTFLQYLDMGVDAIVTDSPDKLRDVLPPG